MMVGGGRRQWQPTEPRSGVTPLRCWLKQVSDTVWSSTFQDVRGLELSDSVLTLSVPSQLVRQRIEQRYLGLMEAALDRRRPR
jgi:chromosomal replication initiation ATPase DnaA